LFGQNFDESSKNFFATELSGIVFDEKRKEFGFSFLFNGKW